VNVPTFADLLSVGGVIFAAGVAVAGVKQLKESQKDQGRRIGGLEDRVKELEVENRVLRTLKRRLTQNLPPRGGDEPPA